MGLTIVGWVGLARPFEIPLYDWWPIGAQPRPSERLATMPVEINHAGVDPVAPELGHPVRPEQRSPTRLEIVEGQRRDLRSQHFLRQHSARPGTSRRRRPPGYSSPWSDGPRAVPARGCLPQGME